MDSAFADYLKDLAATPLDQHTEHTGRAALETLLKAFSANGATGGIHVQHEPRRQGDKGSPDFKVQIAGQVLGYVEVKPIGTPLDAVLRSEQIAKYKTLSGNILLTDYLEWIWLGTGG